MVNFKELVNVMATEMEAEMRMVEGINIFPGMRIRFQIRPKNGTWNTFVEYNADKDGNLDMVLIEDELGLCDLIEVCREAYYGIVRCGDVRNILDLGDDADCKPEIVREYRLRLTVER